VKDGLVSSVNKRCLYEFVGLAYLIRRVDSVSEDPGLTLV
jgi:hypothetical protein